MVWVGAKITHPMCHDISLVNHPFFPTSSNSLTHMLKRERERESERERERREMYEELTRKTKPVV